MQARVCYTVVLLILLSGTVLADDTLYFHGWEQEHGSTLLYDLHISQTDPTTNFQYHNPLTLRSFGTVHAYILFWPMGLADSLAAYPGKVVKEFRPGPGVPELEEMEPNELGRQPEGVAVRNIYFDITPGRLVKGIFTEKGLVHPRRVKKLAARWLKSVDLLSQGD